jgi:hypothetical protein
MVSWRLAALLLLLLLLLLGLVQLQIVYHLRSSG